MSAPIAVLRPEPGNARTARRVAAIGLRALCLPLFEVLPVPWMIDGAGDYDALVLASANAVRLAGDELQALRDLPVYAVGAATAKVAGKAGLDVMATGAGGARELLALLSARRVHRALHLGGRDRTIAEAGPIARAITVYESNALPIDAAALRGVEGSVALLHSARAAARLAELTASGFAKNSVRIAAISDAVARAAGSGWQDIATASAPTDPALLDVARQLAD